MKKLFGTDGIRAKAGEFPLNDLTVEKIGFSVVRQLSESSGRQVRIVTGRDTRESGEMIERAFHRGAALAGGEIVSAGVITTPGVAFLTGKHAFDAGVVISASHNPYQDNGIKVFTPTGKKIDEAIERLIESDVLNGGFQPQTGGALPDFDISRADEYLDSYVANLLERASRMSLFGKRIVVDCANGAASKIAPSLFNRLGGEIVSLNCRPDGKNINENCGSTHIGGLCDAVRHEKADFGIAFDGDADRALFVDENGDIVDGDATLWILARYLKSKGRLLNSMVIATVMSNIGLELALRSKGIELVRTDVGDKYVLEKLIETGSEIGGEQSGHIIFPEVSLVGDGMVTALLLMSAVNETGTSLSRAVDGFVRFPQILVNVKVDQKLPFENVPAIAKASAELSAQLAGHGRLLLRYSGTENLARVMIEGNDQAQIEHQANELASLIRSELG